MSEGYVPIRHLGPLPAPRDPGPVDPQPVDEPLNQMGAEVLANSARWFPHLHTGDAYATAAHFVFGAGEEVGEILGAFKKLGYGPHREHGLMGWDDFRAKVAEESWDAIAYIIGLNASLGNDLDAARIAKVAVCEERWG